MAQQQPMSANDYARYRREAAENRQKRGFITFTRASVREEVMGRTRGENKLQMTQRQSQINRRKDRP